MDVPSELVRAAQSGDREALEQLISRSYRPAFTLARRLLGNNDDASEATQEAFVRIVRSIKGFREPEAYVTWMFRIVSNVCLSEMRKRSRRAVPTESLKEETDVSDTAALATDRVFRAEVDRCLARLPNNYRTVIVLRDVYGLSGEETAQAMGITPGAEKVRLHRARRRLRAELLAAFPDWGRESGEEASA